VQSKRQRAAVPPAAHEYEERCQRPVAQLAQLEVHKAQAKNHPPSAKPHPQLDHQPRGAGD
jgi:hypothetical protein